MPRNDEQQTIDEKKMMKKKLIKKIDEKKLMTTSEKRTTTLNEDKNERNVLCSTEQKFCLLLKNILSCFYNFSEYLIFTQLTWTFLLVGLKLKSNRHSLVCYTIA